MLCRWGQLRKHQVPVLSARGPKLEEGLSCGLAKSPDSAAWQVPASLASSATFPAESFLHPATWGSSEGHVASCLCAHCPFLQKGSAPFPHSTHPLTLRSLITRSCWASPDDICVPLYLAIAPPPAATYRERYEGWILSNSSLCSQDRSTDAP